MEGGGRRRKEAVVEDDEERRWREKMKGSREELKEEKVGGSKWRKEE